MTAFWHRVRPVMSRSLWLYGAAFLILIKSVNFEVAFGERTHYLLGLFYNGHFRNFRNGIVYFDHLLRHDPNDVINLHNIAVCYGQIGQDREAEKYLLRAQALQPQDPSILLDLATIYKRMGRLQEANAILAQLSIHN